MNRPNRFAAAVLAGTLAAAAQAAPACKPGEPHFFRDEGLTMKAATKVQFNKALLREKIGVKVTAGVATLSGGVSTPEQIALAAKIVSEIEGIHCVNNFLKVGPSEGG